MSQEAFGFQISSNQTQVSRYERGENIPTGDVLVKMADALDTTTDWLLGRTDYPDKPMRGTGDLDEIEIEAVQLLRRMPRPDRPRILNAIKAMLSEVV